MKKTFLASLSLFTVLLAGCGGSGNTPTVTGSAAIVMGPGASSRSAAPSKGRTACSTTANGNWALTPDKAQVTFTSMTFIMDSGSVITSNFNNCVVTYDRTKTSGSTLLSCPIQIPIGNIVAMHTIFSNAFQVLISDSTNCIFTDGTAFTSTAPSGGAQYSTFTVTSQQGGSFDIYDQFTTPFTSAAGSTPTLSIVADMVHATNATASGGAITFDPSLPSPLVAVFGTFSTAGSSQYYTPSPTSTSLNVNIGAVTGGEGGIRVSYLSTNEPAHVFHAYVPSCAIGNYPTEAWSANPANSPATANGFRAGGYLGLSSGIISWALPVDFTYATYRTVIELQQQTTLGSTAQVRCEFLNGGQAPVPTSGDTYASGAPTLTGAFTSNFILVAQ